MLISSMFMVSCVKITFDRDQEVQIGDTYIGGLCDNYEEVTTHVRNCVNNAKNSTVLTKVNSLSDKSVLDVLYESADYFESIVKDMNEANRITIRSKKQN